MPIGENGDRYIQFVHNSADCGTFAGVHYKAISGVDKEVLSEVKKTYQRNDEKMTKVFNVWLIVEEIDEAVDENGKDINAWKLAQFKTEKEADDYVEMVGTIV